MSFPSLFAILFARAHLPRLRVFGQWLPALVFALVGLLGSSMAQATVYTFNGAAVYSCTLANKVYTCPTSAYLAEYDQVVIADGYTVKVNNNVVTGYNHGLTMSGTARLIVTGDLNIAAMNPANLKVTGGDFDVGATFSAGSIAIAMTANVKAAVIQLGTDDVTITGSLISTGLVNLSSDSRVNGNVTGTVVTTGANVVITGNVTASSKVTLESGSKVGGNVDTGDLVLLAASAVISGNASVNSARLEQWGKVTGTIYCKNGTARNKCDCVTNNSGYKLNTEDGPRCESPLPKGPHHFLITHDGLGDTCVPEKVNVRACANAACTAPHYTAGVSGTLGPFGEAFTIPAGTESTDVLGTRIASGAATLGVTSAAPADLFATTCLNTGKPGAGCTMEFIGGAKLLLSVPDHYAGDKVAVGVAAVKQSDNQKACVPAFKGVQQTVAYSCGYSKPKSGTQALSLNGTALACPSGTFNIPTDFDVNGKATTALTLSYPDAGEMALAASITTAAAHGNTTFKTAPKSFAVANASAVPIRAGAGFKVEVRALNAANEVTKNFDTTALNNASATDHAVALAMDCPSMAGAPGDFSAPGVPFVAGVGSFTATWTEVGKIDLKATLARFLGSNLASGGSTRTDTASCHANGKVGPFIPAYFKVAQVDPRTSYYSGEPIALAVTAMSQGGTATQNYTTGLGLSEAATLTVNKTDGTAFAPSPGSLGDAVIAATAFENGVAKPKPVYTFAARATAPTQVRLRAASATVTSALPDTAEQAKPFIRSGRLRLGSRFGNLRGPLTIPVMAEYWTGRSWLLNDEDSHTVISSTSFAFTLNPTGMTLARTFTPSSLTLAKGTASFGLQLTAGGPGRADIAVNLGAAGEDNSCIAVGMKPATTGAAIPWLRPLNTACSATIATDPVGRATFGIFTPEQRRIIHVREVFN
ncbi:DUF6701 domain-containing protein [Telluria aromaticivorans]|uniref:Polymer-forming cytoskeletal protein n=1 Tax=Telluria aromaticivorans TaxID=2725995 RepID=A0A7Y2P1Y3_9BURK|nr:DUF6701 domain-containing protein [Telluria aromaticivorans]NNG25708.1 polymer-forming cytoskeletal protein [Telluria aromaticivorans]